LLTMLRSPSFGKSLGKMLYNSLHTQCDAAAAAADVPSLVEAADAAIEDEKGKVKTPMQFEGLRGTLMQGSPNAFDGFRVVVQKQVNLNTVVSHL